MTKLKPDHICEMVWDNPLNDAVQTTSKTNKKNNVEMFLFTI